ncbi:Zn-dependent hydrolase OS=Stutzerimonas stutzeri OX=316 GN=CXK95_18655 PE=3 SV=1 [Stutzerimonas stutzeri]
MFARNGRAPAKRFRSPTGAARLLGLLAVLMFGLVGSAAAADGLRFSLIKTAQSDT